jgi:hypothetical protein
MIPGRWVMWTIIFEDNSPIDDFEDGIVLRLYMNDVMFMRKTAKGSLRLNEGPLHFLPNEELMDGIYLSNFTYFPWAMTEQEIGTQFRRGVRPKGGNMCSSGSAGEGEPLVLPVD